MKIWLIIINNFLHDLFTGLWISTILVIYLLQEKVPSVHQIPANALKDVMKVFFILGVFSLLIIIVTGIFRSINYNLINSRPPMTTKKKALIIKHILLGLIFIIGTYLSYRYTFN
jgi:putative copper export protein